MSVQSTTGSRGVRISSSNVRGRLKCDGTHTPKPDFFFRRNGRVNLNRPGGCQFSRLLAAEVCASMVVMLDKPCSEVV